MKKLIIAALIASVCGVAVVFGFKFLQNPQAMTGSFKALLKSAPAPLARFVPPIQTPDAPDQPAAEPAPKTDDSAGLSPDIPAKSEQSGELLTPEHVKDFIHSYYEGVENKDLDRVAGYYDAVVACGAQGLRTRTAIRTDIISYFAQYRSLLIGVESVHVDLDPHKASARVSFVLRYKKIPEVGNLDSGHGNERWTLVVRDNKLAISAIDEQFFAAP